LGLTSVSGSLMGNMATTRGLPHQPGQPDPALLMSKMRDLMAQLAPYTYGLLTGRFLFSVALLIIGLGLYKQRRWGRSGAIAWGALALLFLVAEISINVGIIQPRTTALVQQLFAGMPNADQMA